MHVNSIGYSGSRSSVYQIVMLVHNTEDNMMSKRIVSFYFSGRHCVQPTCSRTNPTATDLYCTSAYSSIKI